MKKAKSKKVRTKSEFDLTKDETNELIDIMEDSLTEGRATRIGLEAYYKIRKLRDKKWEKLNRQTRPDLLKQWNNLKS